MQWVVTAGRTVEEARRRALDALGVDEGDLDFEILAEPTSRLFGLRRTEARIRARVRPTRPRPKVDRRNRRKASGGGGGRRRRSGGDGRGATGEDARDDASKDAAADATKPSVRSRRRNPPAAPPPDAEPRARPAAAPPLETDNRNTADPGPTGDTMSDISLDEQEPSAVGFVDGLVAAFGVDADVAVQREDEEHLEITVTGDDLGLLVGPRGRTLEAIQELTRTAVAQQHSGRLEGRLRVDVAGYRARRKVALERFALQQAERVRETGTKVALEPMSPPDRKIVHDAINDVDGVRTASEGEDRRRHVVILPD